MFGESDLEEESRARKERIAQLVGKLKASESSSKAAASSPSTLPQKNDHKTEVPPVARATVSASSARKKNVLAKIAELSLKTADEVKPKRRSDETTAPVLPPAPRSPVKDRVSSTLLQHSMEERAKQRRERTAALQKESENRVQKARMDAKRQVDDKQLLEEAKLLRYQAERRLHLASAKESSQLKDQQEMKEKKHRAVAFYSKQLLIRRGLAPLLRLIESARNNWFTAVNFYDDVLLQQAWVALYGFCANKKKERIRKDYRQASLALSHYKSALVRQVFKRWSLHRRMLRAKAVAVTGHFSRFTTNRRAWRAWRDALEKSRRQTVQKLRLAKPQGDRCLLKHCFTRWGEFMRERLLEVEVNARSDYTWAKVKTWLE